MVESAHADSGNGASGSSGSSTPSGVKTPDVQIEVETLIIGAGPAGAALACFLASHGIKGLMVSRAPTNADTPRAHITNAAALECLRDIGLEDSIHNLSTKNEKFMMHTRWCYTMAGREYARIYSWGNDPARKGDYERASPCKHVDLPQTLLEPVLVRHAALNGITCRFDTEFVSFVDEGTHVVTTLRDRLTGGTYAVKSRFLFGADGARSRVQQQLDLPLVKKPQQGLAINVLVKTDLSHLMESRPGNLHWVFQPEKEHPAFAWQAIVRMVKPWTEWMFILLPDPAAGDAAEKATEAEYLARVHEIIGDSTPASIINISKWYINETYAESYSAGNVFCLGDAVHRHPPFNGLGSNTCIQDAFNLAWKVAYVLQGRAGAGLLDSYSAERQPVGKGVVTRANDGFREHFNVWDALGLVLPTPQERAAAIAELEASTPAGNERRRRFQAAVAATGREFHALGIEMNQSYSSSPAVITDEGVTGDDGLQDPAVDTELFYVPSTYPGRRLPHVWLSRAVPDGLVSTVDLAGRGRFTLFTGVGGGDTWRRAAESAEAALPGDVRIRVVTVGYGCEFEDPYFEWARVRGVGEDGCVLVRPDRFVAWRADGVSGGGDEEVERLGRVMRRVLARA
ncbi:Monooxygenase FAD-binding protein [Lasiodiplodia theobromae]|uniref:Monooxygenase FAD-binding protein n=1 Tax=Lasiodiplodia theobromae TaxID=45133 RepID=UPI0015C2F61C|nr:Monooxygenase FAD-binding protein [Lasiodiplodia theobromae]KAF4538062.1 Monooxygenase FAD-binding protein [Lasiodiplodia theobromae]